MGLWIENWIARHRHPVSLALHAVGIPLLAAVPIMALVQLGQGRWDLGWPQVGMIVMGYLLQWIGHLIEGNDMGEVVLIKKLLGRPYTAVAPRYRSDGLAAPAAMNAGQAKTTPSADARR